MNNENNGLKTSDIHHSKVVIVGAGFGGIALAKRLKHAPVDITIIDKHNYHLFQPLLYQISTAGLSPSDIAWPIRSIFKKQANARVVMDEVIGIDANDLTVKTKTDKSYSFDYLILATGARHNYFGHDEWEQFATSIKNIKDALLLRERILLAFEDAEMEENHEREAYLTFVIVGGGPTGVEIAGALVELKRFSLAEDFYNIKPANAKVILIDAGPRLLSGFPENLAQAAQKELEEMGVEILLNAKVKDIIEGQVILEDRSIHAKTIIWAAGVRASLANTWLATESDRNGRIKVNSDLSLPSYPNIFALGDTSFYTDSTTGKILPGTASVAKQQGYYLGDLIFKKISHQPTKPFKYRHYANLATIGRKFAIADFGSFRFKGFFAWLLWSVAHIYFLIDFKSRFTVAVSWSWSYLTYQRGARLIVGSFVKKTSDK